MTNCCLMFNRITSSLDIRSSNGHGICSLSFASTFFWEQIPVQLGKSKQSLHFCGISSANQSSNKGAFHSMSPKEFSLPEGCSEEKSRAVHLYTLPS